MAHGNVVPAEGIGWIDVTEHGAIPNDGVDDTAALQVLISANINQNDIGTRTLYLPDGVYNISDTLYWKTTSGSWQDALIVQGQSRDGTILRLKDNTFTNVRQPQAIIMTASSSVLEDGAGNTAFWNYIHDLTVDTGVGNPGAIGIDYLANNIGALRNIRVISSDPGRVGIAGISMVRDWPGPALLKNVEVIGFNYGIDINNQTNYKTTAEFITLSEQLVAGIRNNAHPLSVRKLFSDNSVPVLRSVDVSARDSATTVILDSEFTGGDPGNYAIEYEMSLYLRNIEISGYKDAPIRDNNNAIDTGSRSIGEYVSHAPYSKFPSPASSLMLPIEETPEGPNDPVSEWVRVEIPNSAGIQAAIDKANLEGKSTIYLPTGSYLLAEPVIVSGGIRRIVGNGAALRYRPSTLDTEVFVIGELDGPDLTIESVSTFANVSDNDYTWFYHDSDDPLVLKDINARSGGRHYLNTKPAKLFIENCAMGNVFFNGGQVWARQFDPENADVTKMTNRGGDLWILGLKTEWPATVLENYDGARAEILGSMFYPPFGSNPRAEGIAILNDESRLAWIGTNSGEANRIQVRDIRDGVTRDYTISDSFAAGHPRAGQTTPLYVSWTENTWYGYPVGKENWVDTAGWLHWVNIALDPWVWQADLSKYIYLDDDSGWIYIPH